MKGQLGIPTIRPSGKLGNVVFIRTADGYTVRERVTPANPRTPAQTRARQGFGRASQGWNALSDEAFAAWNAYGESVGTTGQLAYMSLTRKWLAVHPNGTPPTMPPSGPFFGDAVRLTISREAAVAVTSVVTRKVPVQCGGTALETETLRGLEPGSVPTEGTATSPAGLGSSILSIHSDRPNSAGVVTEILVQPLANVRRKPKDKEWKTAAFVAFTTEDPTASLPLEPGAWAVAYRFVDATTGQASPRASLGAVMVS